MLTKLKLSTAQFMKLRKLLRIENLQISEKNIFTRLVPKFFDFVFFAENDCDLDGQGGNRFLR